MPFQTYYVDQGRGVVHHGVGEIRGEDILGLTRAEGRPPELLGKPRYALVDLMQANFVGVSGDLIREVAGENEIREEQAQGQLIAVAAASDHIFGISRMWQMLVDKLNWSIQIFRSREEAVSWIQSRYPDASFEPVE